MIEIPQTDEKLKDEQIEGLGLDLQEEPVGMLGTKQILTDEVTDAEALRRQKTHNILTNPQLTDLIGVKNKKTFDLMGVRTEDIEVSIAGNLKVSLFWEEKILMFIHTMQLIGFYFVVFKEQVPEKYAMLSNIFTATMLKIDYIASYNLTLTQYSFGFLYCLLWSIPCIALFIVYFSCTATGCLQRFIISYKESFFKYAYYFFEIIAFPFLMNTAPYAVCLFNTKKIDVELYTCWNRTFHIVIVVLAAITAAVVLGVSIILLMVINQNYVYDNNDNHEAYVKMKELEYVFDLSHVWRTNWFYLFASFRREGFAVFHRAIYYWFMLALTAAYVFMGNKLENRFYVIAIIVVLFNLYITLKPPYRCGTSNIVYVGLMWGSFPTLIMLYLRTTDMRSALIMVDDNFGNFLIALNVFIILLIIMLFGIFIVLGVRWPVDHTIVEEVMSHPRFISMLGHLKEAKNMSIELAKKRRFYFVNKQDYLDILGYLEHDFTEADKLKHFFKDIILEFIEELSQYYPMVISESLLPHPRLEGIIDTMRQVFLRRAREQILINPRRQKVLLYLLTFRMIYDQYWAGKETSEMLKKAIAPTKLTPLEEMRFRKGSGQIDPKHQNIVDADENEA